MKNIFKSKKGEYYKLSLVKNHYPNKLGKEKEYIRRVYGDIRKCINCKKKFFSTRQKHPFCSNSCSKKGKLNPRWAGGRYKAGGYIMLNLGGKIISEHRYLMEKYLGRKLRFYEIIHHKNAIKTDNRLENLEIILQYPKSGFHKGFINCPKCNYEFSIK